MYKILDDEILILESLDAPLEGRPELVYREEIDKVEICLSVMQQMCENHNNELQNYLR